MITRTKTKTAGLLFVFVFTFHFSPFTSFAQPRVLFIGNSYTEVNNLPQMTADVARSMGFEMTYSSNTPGGCTFSQHCTNQSMALIRQGGWDFVVLQEQSQLPSFPQSQVEDEVLPYAAQLVQAVYASSPCAEPMFYMTWGRRDGDTQNARYFPVLGSYEGMDSMLCLRYLYMAETNDASVCPVGRVWRHLREEHPDIELYQSDGSHPSIAGTYASACAFAVMFFHGNPEDILFVPSGLPDADATIIREAVHDVVYSHDQRWHRPRPQIIIDETSTDGFSATLTLHPRHADSLLVDFGDGFRFTTLDTLLQHTYTDTGIYNVTLVAMRHCMTDTATTTVHITDSDSVGIAQCRVHNLQLSILPNPSSSRPVVLLDDIPVNNTRISVITPDGKRIPFSTMDETTSAGVYLISVKTERGGITGRFLKQ